MGSIVPVQASQANPQSSPSTVSTHDGRYQIIVTERGNKERDWKGEVLFCKTHSQSRQCWVEGSRLPRYRCCSSIDKCLRPIPGPRRKYAAGLHHSLRSETIPFSQHRCWKSEPALLWREWHREGLPHQNRVW